VAGERQSDDAMTTPFLRSEEPSRPRRPSKGNGNGNGHGKAHDKRRWRLSDKKKVHVDAVRNDINVTPLVDVMLVLLIIFMLMTMIMGRGYDVHLPRAENFSAEQDKNQPVVSVDSDGNLYVERKKLGAVTDGTLREMADQVRQAWDKPKAEKKLFIKADITVPYSKMYPVLIFIHEHLELDSINLAIAKKPTGGS